MLILEYAFIALMFQDKELVKTLHLKNSVFFRI